MFEIFSVFTDVTLITRGITKNYDCLYAPEED